MVEYFIQIMIRNGRTKFKYCAIGLPLLLPLLASKSIAQPSTIEQECLEARNLDDDNSKIKSRAPSCTQADLPRLSLSKGYKLQEALIPDQRISVSLSALSQNNGTTAGLSSNQFTSSNLFNFGLQIGPFSKNVNDQDSGSRGTRNDIGKAELQKAEPQKAESSLFYERIRLNALFTQRSGEILSSKIPNILNTQWNFGNGPIARLNILNLEYNNPEGIVSSIKLGKLMQAQDFTVNPIQCFYSNFGLCGWAQGTPAMVAIPGNPFNSYGAVIKLGKEKGTNLKYGIYQLAPNTYAPQYHGLNFRFDQAIGTAHFVELSLPLKSDSLLPVHSTLVKENDDAIADNKVNALYETPLPPTSLTLGGWLANGKFPIISQSSSPAKHGSQNNAIYGIASTRLPISWLGMDHRLFISSSIGLTPRVQNFHSGGSAGLVLAGLLPSRPFDTFSIGAAYAAFNREYYLLGTDPAAFTPFGEYAIEVNYNIAVNSSIGIMPNYQYIIQPAGDASRPGISVLGLQVWVQF